MSDKITEVLDRIEARQAEAAAIEGTQALDFLQAIYRNRHLPLTVRLRAAIEALPFESPKLSATAVLQSGADFASLLDRAIERSRLKLIETSYLATEIKPSSSAEVNPMTE